MTTPIDDTPLKPCPFCGEEAMLHDWKKRGRVALVFICCSDCGTRTPGENTADRVISRWNTRAETDLERVANRLAGLINELAEKRTDQLGFYYVSKHMGGIGSELSHKIAAALRDFEELRKQISPDPNTKNT